MCCTQELQTGGWTFNILSPFQSKRLIKHSAGLWMLTRTNSASCWLVTHTGTAMIGCYTLGGTPLIVCLAYFLPLFWWHIRALMLIANCNTKERTKVIGSVAVWLCGCDTARCENQLENKIQAKCPPSIIFFFSFIAAPLFFFSFFSLSLPQQLRSDKMSPLQTAVS